MIKQTVENEKLIQEYETLSSTLLIWIQETIVKMSSREFGNTFAALQQQMADFNVYRTKEKPPKYDLLAFIACFAKLLTLIPLVKECLSGII